MQFNLKQGIIETAMYVHVRRYRQNRWQVEVSDSVFSVLIKQWKGIKLLYSPFIHLIMNLDSYT